MVSGDGINNRLIYSLNSFTRILFLTEMNDIKSKQSFVVVFCVFLEEINVLNRSIDLWSVMIMLFLFYMVR